RSLRRPAFGPRRHASRRRSPRRGEHRDDHEHGGLMDGLRRHRHPGGDRVTGVRRLPPTSSKPDVVGGRRHDGQVQPVVVPQSDGSIVVTGVPGGQRRVQPDELPALVRDVEAAGPTPPRWVWADTNRFYPGLLRSGVRVERAHDLRLCHRILRHSTLTANSALATAAPGGPWDTMPAVSLTDEPARVPDTLFGPPEPKVAEAGPDPVEALRHQHDAVAASPGQGRLGLLLAAESAGALAAAEMHHAGLPWRADVHDAVLTEVLGPRPRHGERPERLEELVQRIRAALDAPASLNPDSHPDLLKAMNLAGVGAKTLRKWELERLSHPVIEPLLEYKSLSRLLTA